MLDLFARWPLLRQLISGGDGTGVEAMSPRTLALRPRHEGASVARSVCPYCAVGCGQLVYHRDGKLMSIEGDPGVAHLPRAPLSRRARPASSCSRTRAG